MTFSPRDHRAIVLLIGTLVAMTVLQFLFPIRSATVSLATASANRDDENVIRHRLTHLRRIAATILVRQATRDWARSDLVDRERGIIQADTAPQAQAAVVETVRRVGKASQIDVRGGDFGIPKAFGDYGLVYVTVTFECRIEQLVNFLTDLSRETSLVVPSEEQITSASQKEKTVAVHMVLAGVVSKRLLPEKNARTAF
jgi:hypothetical protein